MNFCQLDLALDICPGMTARMLRTKRFSSWYTDRFGGKSEYINELLQITERLKASGQSQTRLGLFIQNPEVVAVQYLNMHFHLSLHLNILVYPKDFMTKRPTNTVKHGGFKSIHLGLISLSILVSNISIPEILSLRMGQMIF